MMKLIEDFKNFHKFLSVQLTVLGGALVAFATANPDMVSTAIAGTVSPQNIPMASLGVSILLTLIGRAIDQPSLKKDDDNAAQ